MMQPLIAHQIPLTGRHLIESSAGTGKTYNITRIYLRLLLEKKYTVEQILVMTFTKDATEELRGRIGETIRDTLANWSSLVVKDPFFVAIGERICESEAKLLLQRALLFLDEAAIFTLHGFCKRVLTQYAFNSGLAFNTQMDSDNKELTIQACEDFYRVLAKQSTQAYILLTQFWSTPSNFIKSFLTAINKSCDLTVRPIEPMKVEFQRLAEQALAELTANQALLFEHLVDVKKNDERDLRIQEYELLTQWLTDVIASFEHCHISMPSSFIDGRRYGRSKAKEQILNSITNTLEIKSQADSIVDKINKAPAFLIVQQGIYHIRANVTANKSKLSILTFDDLIKTLAELVSENTQRENSNEIRLAQRLLADYPVALVDEFQDTDNQQFTILSAIYGNKTEYTENHTNNFTINTTDNYTIKEPALYLIGDPKQAIYGFRGGDIFTYLSAHSFCQYHWLMDTNWRSSQAMITGYNRLFYGESLTSGATKQDVFRYNIDYQPVLASPKAENIPDIADDFKALQFVYFENDETGKSVSQQARNPMATWCASEITRLLYNDANNESTIQAQEIAILVRDGGEAANIKEALQAQGLASVYLSNRANLWHSEQTSQLIRLLKGIVFVENERFFTAALTSKLLNLSSVDLFKLQQDEFAWQAMRFEFIALREHWQYRGFISMALQLMHGYFAIENDNKDRILTNVFHLFELLQSASQRYRQPQELLAWLEQQHQLDIPEMDAELRLESDDNLIRIVTQHGSKGLEYPVVFVPFASRYKDPLTFGNSQVNVIEFHNETGQLMVSLDGDEKAKQAMKAEALAESVRLLYVAITRAERRCYIMVAPFDKAECSPLGYALHWQGDTDIKQSLLRLVKDEPLAIGFTSIELDAQSLQTQVVKTALGNQTHNQAHNHTISPAKFTSKIERDWWLSSFSALSKNIRHGGISTPDRDNEALLLTGKDPETAMTRAELRFTLTKGAQTGNLLHDVFEHLSFTLPNWQEMTVQLDKKYHNVIESEQLPDFEHWLQQVLHAPLTNQNCSETFCLADIHSDKTLREAEFYFPMNNAKSSALAKLLTDHRNNAKVDGYNVSSVQLPAYQQLKGMMHGFIDLIFEVEGKYYVCDYKSSHLGNNYDDYLMANMSKDIENNYYDLQYLIYSLALHRQLTHLIENYDFEQHFGGVYYLYLRGMTNDTAYQGAGVYFKKIQHLEIQALDHLFQGKEQDQVVQSNENILNDQ